jgi:tetratricopeptide (TPR) repeat protein
VINIRGRALLASGRPVAAIGEFQRLLDLRGVWPVHPRFATAHLWLGRSHAAAGDIDAAVNSYETFLDIWKDADPDIPMFLEAQAEYEQLIASR